EGEAEVAARGGLDPARVTFRERAIQSILRAQLRDRFGRDARIHARLREVVAGRSLKKQERQDRDAHQQESTMADAAKEEGHAVPAACARKAAVSAAVQATSALVCGCSGRRKSALD